MRIPLTILATILLAACSDPHEERYKSSLRDDLSGVWVYPSEQIGLTCITVVEGHKWKSYTYDPKRIDIQTETNQSDSGEVLGEESVYFLANAISFYSPKFYQRAPNGTPFIIMNHSTYDSFRTTGKLPVQIWIRVADKLDPENPPSRPSIESLGIPYTNIFKPTSDDEAARKDSVPGR